MTDEELITVFAGMECKLYSRLLTYQSSDPRDSVPLTPNHFLHGQMEGQFAPESVETDTFIRVNDCERFNNNNNNNLYYLHLFLQLALHFLRN